MKDRLKARARQLGFDDCRITTAAPPESAPQFQKWLAAGQHGQMAYLERHAAKRIEPRQVLAEAGSIVTLAVSYDRGGRFGNGNELEQADAGVQPSELIGQPSSDSGPPLGIVARYARFEDYHKIIGRQLAALTEFIGQLGGPGTRSLWYVDTGPLLERDLAQRAGLGFIGKHTNLISRQLGNWIFLSEILTTLELEPDAPERNRCGTCARCISACPTGAIKAPFQLDARLCISYLTIELKGSIPAELRPAIGNRIYGCDDCLAVCPWNRFAREGALMPPRARPDLDAPNLTELLGLDETEFSRRFAGTPMLRAKRRGLLRNVCVALGNIGGPSALPALQKTTTDPDPIIAEHASWAINQIHRRADSARALA